MIDYYEFLQINPKAEPDTIHRVYLYLAARLHPDNLKTGNAEMFRLLKEAYDLLSDPKTRAEYDMARKGEAGPPPLSATVDFMDSLEGELNRRLAVLAVLYYRRRTNPTYPSVSLAEIEERMGFPRDYLDFTLWYLVKKGYVTREDNATFALTADAVDFMEKHRTDFPVLHRLLTSTAGSNVPNAGSAHQNGNGVSATDATSTNHRVAASSEPIVLHGSHESHERRSERSDRDRRVGLPDLREYRVERRSNRGNRQGGPEDRRTSDC